MALLSIPKEVKTFGAALKWARDKRGLTQKEVADKADLMVTFYCAVECDKRHTERVDILAKILGVRLAHLEERAGVTQGLIKWLKGQPKLVKHLWQLRRGK